MTGIREQLHQDFSRPDSLLRRSLQDNCLTADEYSQIEQHYTQSQPEAAAEFELAFKDFAQLELNSVLNYEFAGPDCVFPEPEMDDTGVVMVESATGLAAASVPEVRIPKLDTAAQAALDAREFWTFMKYYNLATPSQQAEFRQMLSNTVRELPVSSAKDVSFAREVMRSAKSMLSPKGLENMLPARIQAYEIFTGQNPGVKSVMRPDLAGRVSDVAEKHTHGHQTSLLHYISGPGLDALIANSESPDITGEGNALERLVGAPRTNPSRPSYVDALHQRILREPGNNLDPAKVMQLALEVTNGDYPLAMLAAHNLIKSVAYSGRPSKKYPDQAPSKIPEYLDLVKKLGSLRPEGSKSTDKLGPWYHFFGIQMVAAAYHTASEAEWRVNYEHLIRSDGVRPVRQILSTIGFPVATSPLDKEKMKVDELSLNLARERFREKLLRRPGMRNLSPLQGSSIEE